MWLKLRKLLQIDDAEGREMTAGTPIAVFLAESFEARAPNPDSKQAEVAMCAALMFATGWGR